MRRAALLGACILGCRVLASVPAAMAQTAAPTVDHAWARATPPQAQTAAAYLVVHGGGGDQVTGFATPVANSASLHRSMQAGGVMEMRPVEALPLAPGQDLTLAPGGYHVMLTGLQQPLKAGEHFPLTVTFAHAAPVTVSVTVQPPGASAPGASAPGAMTDMDGMGAPEPAHR